MKRNFSIETQKLQAFWEKINLYKDLFLQKLNSCYEFLYSRRWKISLVSFSILLIACALFAFSRRDTVIAAPVLVNKKKGTLSTSFRPVSVTTSNTLHASGAIFDSLHLEDKGLPEIASE